MSTPAVIEDALSAELDKLGPAIDQAPKDDAPVKPKRRGRSGTSGAERARRAREAAGTASAAPKPRATTRAKRPAIAAGMAQLYTMAGLGISMVPSGPAVAGPHVGKSITGAVGHELVASSAQLGAAWEKAAQEDPRVRDALEKLLAVSTLGAIVAAHLPAIMAGLVAAGAVPDLSQLGAPVAP